MKTNTYDTNKHYISDRLQTILKVSSSYPLSVIEAPMGYGKSVAARYFVEMTDCDYLWQNVYSHSAVSFWQAFSNLFQKLDEKVADSLRHLGIPSGDHHIHQAVTILEDLDFDSSFYIVIDDFHHIEDRYILHLIERLGETAIPNLHVVVTGRFNRLERLEELVLKGCAGHIKQEDLAFTKEAIKDYFRQCGIVLKGREVEALYDETEGWISGLYMMMVSYKEEGGFETVDSLYGLIEKTLYSPLTEEIQNFLMAISVFDSFTKDQAGFIWDKGNSQALIQALLKQNHFISYNLKNHIYHIHSLFLGYIRSRRQEQALNLQKALYQKAAEWFMKAEAYREAAKYFYRCRDFDGLMTAVAKDNAGDDSYEHLQQLIQYFDRCPKEIREDYPFAQLIYARQLFLHKELRRFSHVCTEIQENLESNDGLDHKKRNRLLGEMELLLSFSEFRDIRQMVKRYKKAWDLLQAPSRLFTRQSNWTFGVPSILSLYHSKSGSLAEFIEEMQEGLQYYYKLTDGHGSGAENVALAEYAFNQGDFFQAEVQVERAVMKAKMNREENIYYSARYIKLLILFMLGRFEEVGLLLDELHRDTLVQEDFHRIHVVEICEGCIFAYLDQMDRIPKRLKDIDPEEVNLLFPAYPFFNIMYGRILLNEGAYSKLIGISEYFMSVAAIHSNVLSNIYTYIYLSAAYRMCLMDREAKEALIKALDLAVPDRQYMLFVENCDYIGPVLESVQGEGLHVEVITTIRELYLQYEGHKRCLVDRYCSRPEDQLTDREKEIAKLAAEGNSNQAIADGLFISINTVKKALKSVYAKLGVSSRLQLRDALK